MLENYKRYMRSRAQQFSIDEKDQSREMWHRRFRKLYYEKCVEMAELFEKDFEKWAKGVDPQVANEIRSYIMELDRQLNVAAINLLFHIYGKGIAEAAHAVMLTQPEKKDRSLKEVES